MGPDQILLSNLDPVALLQWRPGVSGVDAGGMPPAADRVTCGLAVKCRRHEGRQSLGHMDYARPRAESG